MARYPAGLRPNAGTDRRITDTDGVPGEDVVLNGSQSSNAGGPIAIYQWLRAGQPIATSAEATVRVPDGNNLITLLMFDDRGNSAAASVRIFAFGRPEDLTTLSQLPGLTPNQQSMGQALDELCPRLRDTQASLVGDQLDLLERCRGLSDSSTDGQVAVLDEITPDELNSISSPKHRPVAPAIDQRHRSPRRPSRRCSGLQPHWPDARIRRRERSSRFPGCRNKDDAGRRRECGSCGRQGNGRPRYRCMDARQLRDGRKTRVSQIAAFTWTAGGLWVASIIDWRQPRSSVSLSATDKDRPRSTRSALAVWTQRRDRRAYATMYNERGFYFDAIASYLQADYGSVRRMFFTERSSLVDRRERHDRRHDDERGAEHRSRSAFSRLYVRFQLRAPITFADGRCVPRARRGRARPRLRRTRLRNRRRERGLRFSYSWKNRHRHADPAIRGEYIHELSDSAEDFDVQFADDPFEDTESIVIEGEVPDESYWRLAAGFSARLRHGHAAFIEYQRLQSNLHIDYTDVMVGCVSIIVEKRNADATCRFGETRHERCGILQTHRVARVCPAADREPPNVPAT